MLSSSCVLQPPILGCDSVLVWRTRDLARFRADGTLEYCGRADGFAKAHCRHRDLLHLGCITMFDHMVVELLKKLAWHCFSIEVSTMDQIGWRQVARPSRSCVLLRVVLENEE